MSSATTPTSSASSEDSLATATHPKLSPSYIMSSSRYPSSRPSKSPPELDIKTLSGVVPQPAIGTVPEEDATTSPAADRWDLPDQSCESGGDGKICGGRTTGSDQDDDEKSEPMYASDMDLQSTQQMLLSTKFLPPSQPNRPEKSKRRDRESTSPPNSMPVLDESTFKKSRMKQRPPTKRKLESEQPSASTKSSGTLTNDQQSSEIESIPPPKKRRLSSLRDRTIHPRFWYLDGSIVLQLERVLFRYTRSRLVTMSPYFESLFGKNDDVTETFRGLDLYKVENVKVVDFERLLFAFDNAITYASNPPPMPVMASIFRASDTLEFSAYRIWSLGALEKLWSSVLPAPSSNSTFRKPIPWAVEAVNLGINQDLPQLLKRAYYELARTSAFRQLEDIGTFKEEEPVGKNFKAKLSRDDVLKLVALREKLQFNWMREISRPREVDCKRKNGPPCSDNYKGWFAVISKDPSIQEDGCLDPITGLEDMVISENWVKDGGFCEDCVRKWKEHWTLERERLWNNLDVWLEIGTGSEAE